MADGRTHAKATLVATPIVAGVVFVLRDDIELAAWAAAGCISGILLSPDLDQESVSHAEWKLIRATLGIGYVWLAFWGPYASIIRHRSPLSHAPLFGTAFRLLYLWGGAALLAYLFSDWRLPPLEWFAQQPEFWAAAVGLILSDLLHWIFDIL